MLPPKLFPPNTSATEPFTINTSVVATVPDESEPPTILFVAVVPSSVIFACVVTFAPYPPPKPFVIVPPVKLTFVVPVGA